MVEIISANRSDVLKATGDGDIRKSRLRQWSDCSRSAEQSTTLPLATRPERKRNDAPICAVLWTSLILIACVPVPRLEPGITDDQLLRIETGKTTRAEVEAALGKPNVIWESQRVWVYEEGPSGEFLWIIPAGFSGIHIFLTELGDDVVIMRFDEVGRVERVDRRVGPLFQHHYGNFLRAWLAEGGNDAHSDDDFLRPDLKK